MSIYSLTYSIFWKQMLPPFKRLVNFLAWGAVVTKPLQWLRDLFFNDYADGLTYTLFGGATNYMIGDKVKYTTNGLYICVVDNTQFIEPTNTNNWIKISNEYVGLRHRANYTGQKKVLEYALNKRFNTTFQQPPTNSTIYLTKTQTDTNYFAVGINYPNTSGAALNGFHALDFVGISYSYAQYELIIHVPNTTLSLIAGEGVPYTNGKKAVLNYANKLIFAGIEAQVVGY